VENKEKTKEEEKKNKMWFERVDMQRVGVLSGIPMTMLAGLLVGYGVGRVVENRFPSNNLLLSLFVILGCASGFKLVIDYIKRFM
jgi:hypothetical protein